VGEGEAVREVVLENISGHEADAAQVVQRNFMNVSYWKERN